MEQRRVSSAAQSPWLKAYAIHTGILDRTQIAADVLEELGGALDMYESGEPVE